MDFYTKIDKIHVLFIILSTKENNHLVGLVEEISAIIKKFSRPLVACVVCFWMSANREPLFSYCHIVTQPLQDTDLSTNTSLMSLLL